MTLRRQSAATWRASLVLAAAAALVAPEAAAQLAAPQAPPQQPAPHFPGPYSPGPHSTAPEQAAPQAPQQAAPHQAAPQQPKAAPTKAAWLRNEKTAAEKPASAPAGPSNARMALLSALVALLAGAAYMMKRRRKIVVRGASSELSVVTAAKVGPKADVVIVNVGGRRLLLGVTEAQVSRLCWLEGDPDSEDASDFVPGGLGDAAPTTDAPSRGPAVSRAAMVPHRTAPVPAPARGFKDALLGALGRAPAREDPAVAIAAATEDVVVRSSSTASAAAARVAAPAGAPEMVDIEGQAKGLLLRLQKR